LSNTPANIALPAVGASVWASGSHVCRGNRGTFMANARAKAKKTQHCTPKGRPAAAAAISSGENPPALVARYMRATSQSRLPAKVKIMNLFAAYLRSAPPQTPIRKYMGMSMNSQNM